MLLYNHSVSRFQTANEREEHTRELRKFHSHYLYK